MTDSKNLEIIELIRDAWPKENFINAFFEDANPTVMELIHQVFSMEGSLKHREAEMTNIIEDISDLRKKIESSAKVLALLSREGLVVINGKMIRVD